MAGGRWRLKKWVWTRWQVLRFRLAKKRPIEVPTATARAIGLVPFVDAHPDVPLHRVHTFDRLPAEEDDRGLRIATRLSLWLARRLPPHHHELPEVAEDPHAALDEAYGKPYRKHFPRPQRPAAFESLGGPDLGALALASPYALFLERDATDELVWDFTFLDDYEHQPDLCALGVRVVFRADDDSGLKAVRIESTAFGTDEPGDANWAQASRLAVCAATTHLSLTRHFNYVHLIGANHWDVITRNLLGAEHPIQRLVWPHLTNGLYTNFGITRAQLLPDGDFVNIFSFTHAGLMAYYDDMYARFDIAMTDPHADWNRRGLVGADLVCDTQVNLQDLFTLFHDHALRYVRAYYPSDAALADDAEVAAWLKVLDRWIPNGIDALRGSPVTRDGLARLIASFISEGIVIHDLCGTALWNYQTWSDQNPTRVYQDGRRVPVDVYQRTINNNFGLQLRRAQLLADYSHVAVDATGAELFRQFHDECHALQARYDDEPGGLWRMEPKNLEINMNG